MYEKTEDLIVYLVSFWNGVDLRYRSFDKPKIRLNIAGIIIPEVIFIKKFLMYIKFTYLQNKQ